ncbi:MAG: hypothetical protein V3S40_02900 [Kiloniellales bacterium]
MGEIVDLERYRKLRKRRSMKSEDTDLRRTKERVRARRKGSQATTEPVEAGGAEPDRAAKIDRDDQTAD